MPVHLADATWPAVSDADARLAVLPVGSTEQHGPHAPLGTDARLAEVVTEAGVDSFEGGSVGSEGSPDRGDPSGPEDTPDGDGSRTDDDGRSDDDASGPVLVAPTLPVGVSEEHRAFAGTLWLSPETFRATIRETVTSLAAHGVAGVVVVNGHGGNVGALREACARLTRDGVARTVPFTWFDAITPVEGIEGVEGAGTEMGHAGPWETALLRHAAPEFVDEAAVEAAAEGAADRWGEWVGGTNLAVDVERFAENGVVGDPRSGSAELGAELLAAAAAALADVLVAVDERTRG